MFFVFVYQTQNHFHYIYFFLWNYCASVWNSYFLAGSVQVSFYPAVKEDFLS